MRSIPVLAVLSLALLTAAPAHAWDNKGNVGETLSFGNFLSRPITIWTGGNNGNVPTVMGPSKDGTSVTADDKSQTVASHKCKVSDGTHEVTCTYKYAVVDSDDKSAPQAGALVTWTVTVQPDLNASAKEVAKIKDCTVSVSAPDPHVFGKTLATLRTQVEKVKLSEDLQKIAQTCIHRVSILPRRTMWVQFVNLTDKALGIVGLPAYPGGLAIPAKGRPQSEYPVVKTECAADGPSCTTSNLLLGSVPLSLVSAMDATPGGYIHGCSFKAVSAGKLPFKFGDEKGGPAAFEYRRDEYAATGTATAGHALHCRGTVYISAP